jgi:hypothetical protein
MASFMSASESSLSVWQTHTTKSRLAALTRIPNGFVLLALLLLVPAVPGPGAKFMTDLLRSQLMA